MVKELTGSSRIKYHANGMDNEPIDIDFTPPFRYLECGIDKIYHSWVQNLNFKLMVDFA